jgi:hypothetical protein
MYLHSHVSALLNKQKLCSYKKAVFWGGIVRCAFNPSTWKVKVGGWKVPGQQGYTARPYFKNFPKQLLGWECGLVVGYLPSMGETTAQQIKKQWVSPKQLPTTIWFDSKVNTTTPKTIKLKGQSNILCRVTCLWVITSKARKTVCNWQEPPVAWGYSEMKHKWQWAKTEDLVIEEYCFIPWRN